VSAVQVIELHPFDAGGETDDLRPRQRTTWSPPSASNTWQQLGTWLVDVERLCDPGSIRHLDALRVGPGWRCLEVGGSSAGIACWLRDRVGPTGTVVTVGTNSRLVDDLLTDTFEAGVFDLVHARLVLAHLRDEREPALRKLVAALAPGGWILVEDADWRIMGPPAPPGVEALLLHAQAALECRGFDPCLGRRLTAMLAGAGLVEVGAAGRLFVESEIWADRWRDLLVEVREQITSVDVASEAAFDGALGWFQRSCAESSTTLIAAWGRRHLPRSRTMAAHG
jgi:SAM-dependent methyltransferase